MEILELESAEIDPIKWNNLITNSEEGNFYALFEVLEACERNWKALVAIEHHTYIWCFPFQIKKKFFTTYIDQDPFSCELGSFHRKGHIDAKIIEREITILFNKTSIVNNYRLNVSNTHFSIESSRKKTHLLDLNKNYDSLASSYNKNRKRELKKAITSNFIISEDIDIDGYILFFKQYTAPKINGFEKYQLNLLRDLLFTLKKLGLLEQYNVFDKEMLLSSVILINFKDKLTYYFSSNATTSKNTGSSTLLINHILKKYHNQPLCFDFEGSNDENISRFYKSFGSHETLIKEYNKNELPFLFKVLRQFKNSLISNLHLLKAIISPRK